MERFLNPYTEIQVDPNVRVLYADSLVPVSPFRWELTDAPASYPNFCIAQYYDVAAIAANK